MTDIANHNPTHYETLGVHIESNNMSLRRAWLLAALKYHPDRHVATDNSDDYELQMQRVNEAYQILSDPAKRHHYNLQHGLIVAACASCGKPGSLRLGEQNITIAMCDICWHPGSRAIAL